MDKNLVLGWLNEAVNETAVGKAKEAIAAMANGVSRLADVVEQQERDINALRSQVAALARALQAK
jgi:predicted house-cleaning noncanonical NTP pyrophosphatase (MazG superfamily)